MARTGRGRIAVAVAVVGTALALVAAHAGTRGGTTPAPSVAATKSDETIVPVVLSAEAWRKRLTPQQFSVLREAGTERAFTGQYWANHAKGTYVCAGCGLTLFSSTTKYESGTGWPSFWQPIAPNHVVTALDASWGEDRTEVKCARCGGHLGHVFEDGPAPTGLRYCMNSAALRFIPAGKV